MKSKLWLVGCLALVLFGATLSSWRWRYSRQLSMLQGAAIGGSAGTLIGYAIGTARRPGVRGSKQPFPMAEDL
jgi:hypothetical protein